MIIIQKGATTCAHMLYTYVCVCVCVRYILVQTCKRSAYRLNWTELNSFTYHCAAVEFYATHVLKFIVSFYFQLDAIQLHFHYCVWVCVCVCVWIFHGVLLALYLLYTITAQALYGYSSKNVVSTYKHIWYLCFSCYFLSLHALLLVNTDRTNKKC